MIRSLYGFLFVGDDNKTGRRIHMDEPSHFKYYKYYQVFLIQIYQI